ncbi:hypothetical protein D3C73_1289810 [compost metagenome]
MPSITIGFRLARAKYIAAVRPAGPVPITIDLYMGFLLKHSNQTIITILSFTQLKLAYPIFRKKFGLLPLLN